MLGGASGMLFWVDLTTAMEVRRQPMQCGKINHVLPSPDQARVTTTSVASAGAGGGAAESAILATVEHVQGDMVRYVLLNTVLDMSFSPDGSVSVRPLSGPGVQNRIDRARRC